METCVKSKTLLTLAEIELFFSFNLNNMGKNKTKSTHQHQDKDVEKMATTSSSTVKKIPKPQPATEKLEAIIKSVDLPENVDGLTADKLTENQKHALKKVCAKMYGHQHSVRKSLPAYSLESATVQLAAKMKEKLAQQKRDKKMKKQQN